MYSLLLFTDTPLLSACELRRQQAINRSSSGRAVGAFVPRCTADGYFQLLQCHSSTGDCWCVDRTEGFELIGSRQRVPSMPDCRRFTGKIHSLTSQCSCSSPVAVDVRSVGSIIKVRCSGSNTVLFIHAVIVLCLTVMGH